MTDNRTIELLDGLRSVGNLHEFAELFGFNWEDDSDWTWHDVAVKMADELEQAIAATLGRGTGEWVLEHSGALYDKWRCSKCGYLFVEPRCDQGYSDLEPNFCPKCGVDFREEGDLIG